MIIIICAKYYQILTYIYIFDIIISEKVKLLMLIYENSSVSLEKDLLYYYNIIIVGASPLCSRSVRHLSDIIADSAVILDSTTDDWHYLPSADSKARSLNPKSKSKKPLLEHHLLLLCSCLFTSIYYAHENSALVLHK